MPVDTYRDLRVYQSALNLCLQIFEISKRFPREERFGLTSQIRRSSRSVCANIAESWHKRRYPAAFVAKLTDAESESAETQVWLDMARLVHYLTEEEARHLGDSYDHVVAQLIKMSQGADKWVLRTGLPPDKASKGNTSPVSPARPSRSSPARQLASSPARFE